MSPDQQGQRLNLRAKTSYTARMMDPIFEIPKDRKPLHVGKLCLLLGLTALLYLMTAHEFSVVIRALIAAAQ